MSERMLFCKDQNKKEYYVFNKDVGRERYKTILEQVKSILKDLKLELNNETWSDEWRKVTVEQWIEISKIPEFDKEVVEEIIGFKLNLETTDDKTEEAMQLLKDKGYKIIKK